MTVERTVLLRDGAVAVMREVAAQDEAALLELHEGLSPRTLYLRFFSASRLSAARYVTRLVRSGTQDHGGVVLEVNGRLVGVAAYESLDDEPPLFGSDQAGCAEAAFVVSDDQHGRGVGTLLLQELAALARQRGIYRFVAETLPDNAPMLDVFRAAGYEVTFQRSLDTVQVTVDLTPGAGLFRAVDRREVHASRASLRALLNPRSVAIVGASSREHSIGAAVLHNVIAAGFAGPVYPVNTRLAATPGPHAIQGVPAFASLPEVPGPVDLVVVAVPPPAVLAVIDQCRQVHATAMVIISAGFADAGPDGVALQERLIRQARLAGVRIVGPNCLGITSTQSDGMLGATFAPSLPLPGRVGVLSQSGGLGIALLEHTRRAGIGMSSFVSVGNKVDVSGNDLLSWWGEDPATDVAVLYLESFGNPRKFARLARDFSLHKPIVAIKAGRTAIGARAAHSHTAAAASPARSVAALFQQAGVINVEHVGELVDVVTLLSSQPLPQGPGLAIIGNAGGPGVLAADAAAECGLELPALAVSTMASLRAALPAGATVTNPVDTIASANGAQFAAAVQALLADPAVDALLAVLTPTPLTEPEELLSALAAASAGSAKPVAVTRVGSDTVAGLLQVEGQRPIPCYPFPETAVRALGKATGYRRFLDRPTGVVPRFTDIAAEQARGIITGFLAANPAGGWLAPGPLEDLLGAYGISSQPSRVVSSAHGAGRAATELGLPAALKAIGPDLVHKSDVGGVALGLPSAEAVRQAYRRMTRELGDRMTSALVQPMAAPGIETIVGVTSDPAFGPLVMFGLGGIWSDLLADHAFRLVPLTDLDAAELVEGVHSSPLLHGYRGGPVCDIEALKDLLLRVAQLADDHPGLAELDLNPVVASPGGVAVLDAKARITGADPAVS